MRLKGTHTRGARRPGLEVWKKRENLNPFVYQESAGRANPHTGYWNPGNAAELPRFPSTSKYTRDRRQASDLTPETLAFSYSATHAADLLSVGLIDPTRAFSIRPVLDDSSIKEAVCGGERYSSL